MSHCVLRRHTVTQCTNLSHCVVCRHTYNAQTCLTMSCVDIPWYSAQTCLTMSCVDIPWYNAQTCLIVSCVDIPWYNAQACLTVSCVDMIQCTNLSHCVVCRHTYNAQTCLTMSCVDIPWYSAQTCLIVSCVDIPWYNAQTVSDDSRWAAANIWATVSAVTTAWRSDLSCAMYDVLPNCLLWPPYVIGQAIYIFILWFLLLSFFPCLISTVRDWMSTILPHMEV